MKDIKIVFMKNRDLYISVLQNYINFCAFQIIIVVVDLLRMQKSAEMFNI